MDTGASHHITSDTKNFQAFSEFTGPDDAIIGDGTGIETQAILHYSFLSFSTIYLERCFMCSCYS